MNIVANIHKIVINKEYPLNVDYRNRGNIMNAVQKFESAFLSEKKEHSGHNFCHLANQNMEEKGLGIEVDYHGLAHEHSDPVIIIQRGPIDNCAAFYNNGKIIILLSGKNEMKLKVKENKLLESGYVRMPYALLNVEDDNQILDDLLRTSFNVKTSNEEQIAEMLDVVTTTPVTNNTTNNNILLFSSPTTTTNTASIYADGDDNENSNNRNISLLPKSFNAKSFSMAEDIVNLFELV
jgi:hypothetical protein